MKKLILLSLFFLVQYAGLKSQTTVSIDHRTSYYYASFYDGGGYFDQSTDEVGMWANSPETSKQAVLWRQLKTTGNNTGSLRPMQIGDKMTITVAAKRARGRIGCTLLSSPSVGGSWANRESNYAITVNLDGPLNTGGFWGNWYIKFKDGGTSSTNFGGIQGTFYNYTFEFILTSNDRMNVNIYDNNGHSYSFYDIQANNTNPITHYSIFLEDDNDGASNQNIYWKPTSSMSNTGLLSIGQSNTSYTISSSITDGLDANSTSSVSENALTKSGTGTITLTANSTYSGATTISAGTLELQGSLANSDVTVASGATLRINGTEVTVKSLTVNAGGTVEIEPGKSLTITGALANSETLRINSDATGTGSLIVNGSAAGNVIIERYLTNYSSLEDAKYHFISSPISIQAIQPEFVTEPPTASVDFYKFDELTNTWINSKLEGNVWNDAFEDNFAVGRGYLVAYPTAPVTKEFSGTLNNDASYTLTCTNTDGQGNGWNLIGNPYSAAVDWDAVTLGDGMDNALYYFSAGSQNYIAYIKIIGDNSTIIGGSRYVPAGQGFMVHAKSSGTKTVTIEKTDLTHNGQDIYYKSSNDLITRSVSLSITGNEFSDKTIVYFNEEATTSFDGSYDAFKLMSPNNLVPMIYTSTGTNVNLAISGLPITQEVTTIPVYLRIGENSSYTIEALVNEIEADVFLEDLLTGTSINLNETTTYSFTASPSDDPNRFLLHFGAVGVSETPQPTPLKAYITNGKLYFPLQGDAILEVIDLQGRMLLQTKVSGHGLTSETMALPAGVYVVQLSDSNSRQTAKVVVK